MKIIKIIILLSIMTPTLCHSQDILRAYIGGNITNVNYHLIDNIQNVDSSGLKTNNILLPSMGLDVEFVLSPKSSLLTGLGVSWMGSKNYTEGIQGNVNLDSDLRIGYIRLPATYNYQIFKDFFLSGGFSFNYNFRKNQGFFSINDDGEVESNYKPFHLGLILGIRKDIANWSFSINYHKGISKLYDTRNSQSSKRAYLTIGGLQVSLGYLIRE